MRPPTRRQRRLRLDSHLNVWSWGHTGSDRTMVKTALLTHLRHHPSGTPALRMPCYMRLPLASRSSQPSYKVLGCHPTGVVLEEDTCGGGSLLEGSALPRYGRW